MKKIFITIGLILVLLIGSMTMVACGSLISSSNQTNPDTTDNNPKTSKMDFAEAAENFDRQTVKKSDIDLSLGATFFVQPNQSSSQDSYTLGSRVQISRVQNGEKAYFSGRVVEGGSDMSSMIHGIIQTLNNPSSVPSLILSRYQGGEELKKELLVYLTTFHHYLTGDITMSAEMGAYQGAYNVKAHFSDNLDASQNAETWFIADKKALRKWLNNSDVLDVTDSNLSEYLMRTVFTQLKNGSQYYRRDTAPQKVEVDGATKYEIEINEDALIANTLLSGLLDIIGVDNKTEVLRNYANYISTVQKWVDVDSEKVVADVKNQLPNKVSTGMTLNIDINVNELNGLISQLKTDGVINENGESKAKKIFNLVSLFLCGSDGQDGFIGVRLHIGFDEQFTYDAAACNLDDDAHADYFLTAETEVAGRVDLRDYLNAVVENVDAYIASYLEGVQDQLSATDTETVTREIREAVAEASAEGVQQFTKKQLNRIIQSVLQKYLSNEQPTE